MFAPERSVSITAACEGGSEVFISADGGQGFAVRPDDRVIITRSDLQTRLIRLKAIVFIDFTAEAVRDAAIREENTTMKFQRQAKILDLIDRFEIETQEDLTAHLRALGYNTTQATISRDIKELRLIKTLSSETGKYKYTSSNAGAADSFTTRLRNIFRECVTDIDAAQNMVVIKTLPGLGQAAAMAIDAMRAPDVVGTLGGDDTVFAVMRDNDSAQKFCTQARRYSKVSEG